MIKIFEGCDFFFGESISSDELAFMMQKMWESIEFKRTVESGVPGSAQLLALKFERNERVDAFKLDFTFTIEVAG